MFDQFLGPLQKHSTTLLSLVLLSAPPALAHADQWTTPTPDELSMTSQSQVPGASAVYLLQEQLTDDRLHMFSTYERIKVLNEGGKRYGNIELTYPSGGPAGMNIDSIAGRTIHPDGTIIPFTGKPYEKLIEKDRDHTYKAKVFSMPDVQVGSIIEYRYVLRFDDNHLLPPQWYVQGKLFKRRAHYTWKPTNADLIITNARGQVSNGIAWTPVLPPGAKVVETRIPTATIGGSSQLVLDLMMQDVLPEPEEDFMPPISSFTYRVLFYYSAYRTQEDFWKNEAKFWSKDQDKFIGPGPVVGAAVRELTLPADTDVQKLRKIYAAVQKLENSRYTREHSSAEDKSEGLGEIKTTDDIWLRKRGYEDQLAQLFIAMARAAGMKAYDMKVTNRDRALFFPAFLSLSQLNDDIVIVNVGGKEVYFDPGSPFCPYGRLAWKHSMAGGIRQTEGSATIATTPAENYTESSVQRVANLTMNSQGLMTGTVKMSYSGAPAMNWRQISLEGDEESFKHALRASMENMLPRSLEIRVGNITNTSDPDKPLQVDFLVKGEIGSATGKRIILPGELFEANSKPTFPHEKREVGVYFDYGRITQDAIRINFPKDFAVESIPTPSKIQFEKAALYSLTTESTPTSVTVRRLYAMGDAYFKPEQYPELRTFYSGMEAKDQQSVVLKIQALSKLAPPRTES